MPSGANRRFNFTLSVDGLISINIHDQTHSTQHKRNEVRTRYSASGEAEVGGGLESRVRGQRNSGILTQGTNNRH